MYTLYLVYSTRCPARQEGQRVEDDVSVLALALGRVEDGAVAVHEHHGGGEVEDARGENECVVGEVVGLADHESVDVEVESGGVEDDHGVEGGGQAHRDHEDEDEDLREEIKCALSNRKIIGARKDEEAGVIIDRS